MKVLFFAELYLQGGLHRFICDLVKNWPKEDKLIFICNDSMPGLQEMRTQFDGVCEVVTHRKGIRTGGEARFPWGIFPKKIRTGLTILRQYGTLGFHVLFFWKLIRRYSPDRIMIINGGYPGGSTCRAVALGGVFVPGPNKPIMNFHNLPIPSSRLFAIPEYLIDVLVGKGVSCFVTVSEICKRQLANRTGLSRVKNLKVIYNGTDIPSEDGGGDIRSELNVSREAPLLLMLATYEARKGHDFLLKAFSKVKTCIPDAHLVIAGDGSEDEFQTVERLVDSYPFSKDVHLFKFRRDAVDLIPQSQVVLVPSQHSESFGLTIVEAMAQRVPVIATAVGGIPEVLENGNGGYVVPLDPDLFADKIILLLRDPSLRKSVGAAGRKVVQERFSVKRMVDDYFNLTRCPS